MGYFISFLTTQREKDYKRDIRIKLVENKYSSWAHNNSRSAKGLYDIAFKMDDEDVPIEFTRRLSKVLYAYFICHPINGDYNSNKISLRHILTSEDFRQEFIDIYIFFYYDRGHGKIITDVQTDAAKAVDQINGNIKDEEDLKKKKKRIQNTCSAINKKITDIVNEKAKRKVNGEEKVVYIYQPYLIQRDGGNLSTAKSRASNTKEEKEYYSVEDMIANTESIYYGLDLDKEKVRICKTAIDSGILAKKQV